MEITNKRVMILGGAGLVGMAICRKVLERHPDELIVASLTEQEAQDACDVLAKEVETKTIITPVGGDIFLPMALQSHSRQELLDDPKAREILINDVLGEFNDDVLQRSFLFQLVKRFRSHIIVDCVNSATAVAYQDV